MVSHLETNYAASFPSCEVVQAARTRLRTSPYPGIQNVGCECDGRGVLFLRGRLSSFYQKQLAQEAVAGLPGVVEVVNETEVAA